MFRKGFLKVVKIIGVWIIIGGISIGKFKILLLYLLKKGSYICIYLVKVVIEEWCLY